MGELTSTDQYGMRSMDRGEPWLVYTAVNWLDDYLFGARNAVSRPFRILEWGCGGSTLWYALRADSMLSIEHDFDWMSRVMTRLQQEGRHNVSFRCVAKGTDGTFKDYSEAAAGVGKGSDLVSVDGRGRVRCMKQIVEHELVCPGGIVVLDNSERHYYKEGIDVLLAAGCTIRHFPGQWRTSIFQRPE